MLPYHSQQQRLQGKRLAFVTCNDLQERRLLLLCTHAVAAQALVDAHDTLLY